LELLTHLTIHSYSIRLWLALLSDGDNRSNRSYPDRTTDQPSGMDLCESALIGISSSKPMLKCQGSAGTGYSEAMPSASLPKV